MVNHFKEPKFAKTSYHQSYAPVLFPKFSASMQTEVTKSSASKCGKYMLVQAGKYFNLIERKKMSIFIAMRNDVNKELAITVAPHLVAFAFKNPNNVCLSIVGKVSICFLFLLTVPVTVWNQQGV